MAKAKSQTSTNFDNNAFDPSKVVVEKNLTTLALKIAPGQTVFVKVTAPMFAGKTSAKKDADGKTRGPATILPIICLHAGEGHECNWQEATITANKVLVSTLNEEYPKETYVGKSFRITKSKDKTKGAGGEYYKFMVALIANQK